MRQAFVRQGKDPGRSAEVQLPAFYIESVNHNPTKNEKRATMIVTRLFYIVKSVGAYLTSSKSTIIHYQCVSTGCCTHVAKTEITIDNHYVTKSL